MLTCHRKGVADEELAKREAERARKRQLEEDEDDGDPAPHRSEPKRQRSVSYDSTSSTASRSTSPHASRIAASPLRRRASPSAAATQPRSVHDESPPAQVGRGAYESESDGSRRSYRSRSPSNHVEGSIRREPLPQRDLRQRPISRRGSSVSDSRRRARPEGRKDAGHGQRRSHSPSLSRSPRGLRSRSRSPYEASRKYRERGADRVGSSRRPEPPQSRQAPEPPRQRSLSPFSKRLALTQAMNMGR